MVLLDKMVEWEKAGYCERMKEKHHCCNPMTGGEKLDLSAGKIKLRLCMDLIRHKNNRETGRQVLISKICTSPSSH